MRRSPCRRCSASSSRSRAASAAAPSCCTTTRRRRRSTATTVARPRPAAATPNYLRWIDDVTDQTTPMPNARASGRSIGTPGAIRMLELAHKDARQDWRGRTCSQPGIKLATNGFPISGRAGRGDRGRAHRTCSPMPRRRRPTSTPTGTPKALGTTLTDPGLRDDADRARQRRRRRALHRPDRAGDRRQDQHHGARADRRRDHAGQDHARRPRRLPGEAARRRSARPTAPTGSAACGRRRRAASRSRRRSASSRTSTSRLYTPTAIDIEGGKPTVFGVHLVSEAERLAYADRDKYVADTDFVAAARRHLGHDAEQAVPAQPRRADQLQRPAWARRSRATSAPVPLGSRHDAGERHDAHDDRRQRRQRAGDDDDGRERLRARST